MPSCAPVAQGANRCLPRPVAFCETSRFPPFSPFFHCLSSSIHQCASLLSLLIQCWKMSSQILLERILADGLKHKWWGKERTRRLRAHICTATWLSVCVHWGLRVCVCVCVWLHLESHLHHQSRQYICITSKNRGHAMLFLLSTNPSCETEADATWRSEAFTF